MSAAAARQIGPWGTVARLVVGSGLLALFVWLGPEPLDLILGLGALPALILAGLALRGRNAPPLRLEGPLAHLANIMIFLALINTLTGPALLFYGVSMLLAGWRGFGACELFAVSNFLRGRDDQLGCPLFLPVDAAEASLRGAA